MRPLTLIFMLLVTAIPSLAWAQLWLDEPVLCGESVEPADHEVAKAAEPDCSTVSDIDDPSFNFCFEEAGNPISTFPEMLAQAKAERLSAIIRARAQERHEAIVALTEPNNSDSEAVEVAVFQPRRTTECSAFDVTCERAPRTPAALALQTAATPPIFLRTDLHVPALSLGELAQRNTSNPGLGPADGIKNVLVPPPDLA